MDEKRYKVFRRSCRSWGEFSTARKFNIRRGLTAEEARTFCGNFNDNRKAREIARGTKYEYTEE